MNNIVKSFLVILSIFSMSIALKAQEDSISVEESTESFTQSDFKRKKEYKYLNPNFQEEKTLFKIGFSPFSSLSFSSSDNFRFSLSGVVSIERKLIPSLSVIASSRVSYSRNSSKYSSVYHSHQSFVETWGLNNDFGVRYYYSMNNRIKNRKGANNFHSNYLSLELVSFASYFNYNSDAMINFIGEQIGEWDFQPSIEISWGCQRRIGTWGVVDIGPYAGYGDEGFGFGLNLLLGFGFGL